MSKFNNPELEKEIVSYIKNDIYQLTKSKISNKFNVSRYIVNKIIEKYSLEKYIFTGTTDETRENISNTLKNKFASGEIKSPWSDPDIHKKCMETAKEKYNCEDYKEIHRKAVETAMKNHNFLSVDEYNNYILEKSKQTRLEKYGDENWNNPEKLSKSLLNRSEEEKYNTYIKTKNTCEERYGGIGFASEEINNKYKETMIERYGVDHNWKSKDPHLNGQYTRDEKYGNFYEYSINKGRQTKLEKYGDEYYNNSEKTKQTCLEKYNVSAPCMLPQTREGLLNQETIFKRFETMKKNGTLRSSRLEEDYYKLLLEFYDSTDIERSYNKDPRYPFHCDFYIKSEDRFIELNFHPTHGKHPFNENNPDDIYTLEELKEKAKTSDYYKSIVDVWSIRDPLKIKAAIENNLNYTMIYPGDLVYDY